MFSEKRKSGVLVWGSAWGEERETRFAHGKRTKTYLGGPTVTKRGMMSDGGIRHLIHGPW